ncbi:MAG: TonB-dependent receptor [Muribaculaceae bacterium]|nr:TonB-dependent receptor [Muribaculaceae bacterium]
MKKFIPIIHRCVLLLMLSLTCGIAIQAAPPAKATEKTATVTINVQNASLQKVLKEIERQTPYRFSYKSTDIKDFPAVTTSFTNAPVATVLDKLFRGSAIRYEIVSSKSIVLLPGAASAEQARTSASGGVMRTASGTVEDADGEPIVGASVRCASNTSIGTTTDANGRFTLRVPDGEKQLLISYIGMHPQKSAIGSDMSIRLTEDATALDEVVVVGFGTQKKVNLTGAVSNVDVGKAIGDRPIVSTTEALQAAVPGLRVNMATQGSPGAGASLNIRGTTSINGGSPLVLVNNVPMDINLIDPQDIETISVLKDAASAAIYGARATFGVILITTKQGAKEQRARVTYNNNFSFTRPIELPRKASPIEEVTAYKKMGWANDTYVDGKNITQWEQYILEYNANPAKYPSGYIFDEKGNLFLMRENDIFSDMMDSHGFQQNHNASVSGGTQRSNYRISFGYTNEDGILITDKDKYRRTNFATSLGTDVTSWLNTSVDVRYASTFRSVVEQGGRNGVWGSAVTLPSYQNIYPYVLNDVEYPAECSTTYILNGEPRRISTTDLRILGRVVITPGIKGLRLTGEYTFNRSTGNNSIYANKYQYVGMNFNGVMNSTENTSYAITKSSTNYNAVNIYANYDFSLGLNNFALTAGFNQEESHYESLYTHRNDVLLENLPSVSGSTGTTTSTDSFSEYAVRGAFYRVAYNYDNRYLLEANGRYDGSSRFPKSNRFGFFPSFSGAWRISQESFMESLQPVLSNLKLRASWGEIGNQNVSSNYPYIPSMGIYQTNWLVNGTRPTTLNAPALVSAAFTWEKASTLDFALDFGLFNNRLSGTLEWYRRDTRDMLAPGMDLPWVIGAAPANQNAADLRTSGWEMDLRWTDRIGSVGYNVAFNLYDSHSKITRFRNETKLLTSYYEGQEIGEIWGYTTDRFYTTDDFNADGSLKEGLPKPHGAGTMNPGDVLYVDYDGDGKIYSGSGTANDPGDRRVIGNTTPRYMYGIRAGVNWNGFDLQIFFHGVGKRDYWRTDQMAWPNGSWGVNFKETLDFWSPENPDAYFPRTYANNAVNTSYNRWVQTKYLADASFFRLQNITLSYTLPRNIVKRIFLDNVRVYVSGENLKTWDHLPHGLEPEMLSNGAWTYPYMRKISFGINLTI